MRTSAEDEKILQEMAKGEGMDRPSLIRYMLRNFTKYRVQNTAVLRLLKDILSTLPPGFKDARIDAAFRLYFETLNVAIPGSASKGKSKVAVTCAPSESDLTFSDIGVTYS